MVDIIPRTILTSILGLQQFDDIKTSRMKECILRTVVQSMREYDACYDLTLKVRQVSDCERINDGVERVLELAQDLFLSSTEKGQIFDCIFGNQIADDHKIVVMSRCSKEIGRLEGIKQSNTDLLDLLTQRQSLRTQLETIAAEYQDLSNLKDFNRSVSSIYVLLRAVDKKVYGLLYRQQKSAVKTFLRTYYGQLIMELISFDMWEEEYIHKLEGRQKAALRMRKGN